MEEEEKQYNNNRKGDGNPTMSDPYALY
jgi:hypothetical protein